MLTQHSTMNCAAGTAIKVTFIYTVTEQAMIAADSPDYEVKSSFTTIACTVDGCYQPLRGMAITLAKAGRFVEAFILQAEYELHFGVSLQSDIDDAIANPDR